jgi:hypothetical protein
MKTHFSLIFIFIVLSCREAPIRPPEEPIEEITPFQLDPDYFNKLEKCKDEKSINIDKNPVILYGQLVEIDNLQTRFEIFWKDSSVVGMTNAVLERRSCPDNSSNKIIDFGNPTKTKVTYINDEFLAGPYRASETANLLTRNTNGIWEIDKKIIRGIDQKHCYQIKFTDKNGNLRWSEEECFYYLTRPSEVKISFVGNDLSIEWRDNSILEDSYRINMNVFGNNAFNRQIFTSPNSTSQKIDVSGTNRGDRFFISLAAIKGNYFSTTQFFDVTR